MTPSLLVRIRLPLVLTARLDALATEIGTTIKRGVSRASLIRAFIRIGLDSVLVRGLAAAIKTDSVRRGRSKGCQGRRRTS